MTETTARIIPLQVVQGDTPSAAPLQAGVKQLGGDKKQQKQAFTSGSLTSKP